MVAMSAAPGAVTLTPPSSSHGGNPSAWKSYNGDSMQDESYPNHEASFDPEGEPLSSHEGNSHRDPFAKPDPNDPFPATKENRSGRSSTRPDNKRANTDGGLVDENSKWIHRDKLAKIESAELQAAGIVLPKPRSHSRPRRDRSTDKLNGSKRSTDDAGPGPRSAKSSAHRATPSMDTDGDSRRTDEKDTSELWITSESLGGPRGGSRIPVPKSSPAPLSDMDRDAPASRKMSGPLVMPDEEFVSAAKAARKSRSRGNSINALDDATRRQYGQKTNAESPKKVTAPRKAATRSASANPATRTQTNRPKTRSGPNRENGSTTARPRTRNGELSSPTNKSAPEGDPPWMINSYKPDPRLPPDQQLLPTVARRLQQEQWEKEGKFGNVYDKDFRPLNEQDHSKSPEPYQARETPESEEEPKEATEQTEQTESTEPTGQADEWPLRGETQSPTPSKAGTSASYSAMPRIQDNPPVSPLASPRMPSGPQPTPITKQPTHQEEPPVQEKPQEKKKGGGCGCCVIM